MFQRLAVGMVVLMPMAPDILALRQVAVEMRQEALLLAAQLGPVFRREIMAGLVELMQVAVGVVLEL
jgi:hypothetical protein